MQRMLLTFWTGVLVLSHYQSHAFTSSLPGCMTTDIADSNVVLSMGKSRKARRMDRVEKQGKSRPQFITELDEIDGKTEVSSPPKESPPDDDPERAARAEEAQRRMEERPDISTLIVDEETGIEVVAQGQSVMDVVTRKAVKLSDLGPEYRLAQMFPGVPPEIREKYRMDPGTMSVEEMVSNLREACSVKLADGTTGIPPHPSIGNKAIDFVLANRDLLGYQMKRTLGQLTMRSMWQGNKEEALEYQKLWKNFLTIENHISAPFRQIMMDGEGQIGPNFGNLDTMSYMDGQLYQRTAHYLVLKGMVAHWEKKVKDANFVETNPQTKENFMTVLGVGDPRRYLPDPPILFSLRECTQVCLMAQQMTKAFCDNSALFDDLPPEVRFLEKALSIQGGTPLRKYVVEEFCPAEGITPQGLREGMRRLSQQLGSMQIDPYGDLTNIVDKLIAAMAVGTDDERNPYAPYILSRYPSDPGYFQTYTFNHEKLSMVRFLDSQYERSGAPSQSGPSGLPNLFNFGAPSPQEAKSVDVEDDTPTYKVPKERAAGRPHNLGWLNLLDDEKESNMRLGNVPPGQIIVE